MTDFAITDDVPVPPRQGVPRGSKYPFDKMKVGASFFAPGVTAATVQSCARRVGKALDARFTTRAVVENGIEGARCWRTA